MPKISRFDMAANAISVYFRNRNDDVFSLETLGSILENNRNTWNLPVSLSADKFAEALLKREILTEVELNFDCYIKRKVRYTGTNTNAFTIGNSLVKKCYLSHYTALILNQLIPQQLAPIYITFEQSKKPPVLTELKQEQISTAFSKPPRTTQCQASYNGNSYILLNGSFTNQLGVCMLENLNVTNLERTLLDVTIRPHYAGGISNVLTAYKNAASRVHIKRLIAMLDAMQLKYPYHQAVGFYLERAGYPEKEFEDLRNREKKVEFYLAHDMKKKEFDAAWKIYYPKGL